MATYNSLRFGPILLLLLMLPSTSSAAVIFVSTTADDTLVNGNCTLREAIIAANTNRAVDRCAAGTRVDVIFVPAGTYVLSLVGAQEDAARTGDLDVAGDIMLRGAGAAATVIDGGSLAYPVSDRVMHVLNGANLVLFGVTIQGGVCFDGGGILNDGILALRDSRIRDNVASEAADHCWTAASGGAGIFNRGRLVVSRSTFSGNEALGPDGFSNTSTLGGGVLNVGQAWVSESVFLSNLAAGGAAIWNEAGDLDVSATQISYNIARFLAGGIYNAGSATITRTTINNNLEGGLVNDAGFDGLPGTLRIFNSTVSGNVTYRAPGSIINLAGNVEITSSTVAHNFAQYFGAGISGAAQLVNTIVANNVAGDCGGPVTSMGKNLDSDGSCMLNSAGDLSSTNPVLGPLADNGGPTWTHALLPGSPAIDHIPRASCMVTTDQRGVSRPQPPDGRCDIGAYELSARSDGDDDDDEDEDD